ncbi:OmpL47-type beta-barrel domain-containing protein [Kitasatospora sp. NPDC052868]|uniref:OmpL47-type beta-barrel domain-containing protein n=1 Tax=Kitasatospora sp. NPDC052868 TaxID=3364060 RepID=UPI0037CA2349
MTADHPSGAAAPPRIVRHPGLAPLFVLALALLTLVATITPAAAARRVGGLLGVNLVNSSDRDLTFTTLQVTDGCAYTNPPARLAALGGTGQFNVGVCEGSNGASGTVSYQVGGESQGTLITLGWNVPAPLDQPNTFTETVPTGYVASHTGGTDAFTPVTFTVDCNSTTCDGIPDDWKRNGVTIKPSDGSPDQFIDLKAMGADVNKPDIFVQVDWMADDTHSHALTNDAIRKVVDAFKNSPFNRHSPTTGINLHVDAGPDSFLDYSKNTTWGTLSKAKKQTEAANLGTVDANGRYLWNDFNKIKTAKDGFISTGRSSLFHYAIAAHNLQPGVTYSGIAAGVPGSDFIISLGSFDNKVGNTNQQAGTLMHELGHDLGLKHGGSTDTPNHQPQYFSVMNYSYQLGGLSIGTTTGVMDYSRAVGSLTEPTLNERQFPASSAGYDVMHWCPNTKQGSRFVTVQASAAQVDWNCDGMISPNTVAFDTNNDGAQTTLPGHGDWDNIQLRGGSIAHSGAAGVPAPTEENEITLEEAAMELPLDTLPPVTTARTDPGPDRHGVYHSDVLVTLDATDDISGVAMTDYRVDGGEWTRYTEPFTVSGDGRHEVEYRSDDHAQNVEQEHCLEIRIDCDPRDTEPWDASDGSQQG